MKLLVRLIVFYVYVLVCLIKICPVSYAQLNVVLRQVRRFQPTETI